MFLMKFSSTYFKSTDLSRELFEKIKSEKLILGKKKKKKKKSKSTTKKVHPKESIKKDETKSSNEIAKEIQEKNSKISESKSSRSSRFSVTPRSDPTSCLVCFENPPNAVLMDCGHGGSS